MDDQSAYAVPKERLAVTVHFADGSVERGAIFLEYAAADVTTHQKISSFLESEKVFFPLLREEAGKTEFVNKTNVRIVEVAYAGDGEKEVAVSLMHAIRIIAEFSDGSTMGGELMAEVPEQKARLSDCLNQPCHFLTMRTDDKFFYVNRAALRRVVHAGAE